MRATVRLQGGEVAKWLAGRRRDWRAGGVYVESLAGGVVVDLRDPDRLPTLDDAIVELGVADVGVERLLDLDRRELLLAVYDAVAQATGNLTERAAALQIELETREYGG